MSGDGRHGQALGSTAERGQFTSQRLKLQFYSWGLRSNPTLVLLHGGRDHALSWADFADRASEEFHVIALDLRGHGGSEWVSDGAYAIEDYLLDLDALVAHLGVDHLYLAGHSLGGNIALRYAGLFPDRVKRLIVIEGLGPSPNVAQEEDARDPIDRLAGWIGARQRVQDRRLRSYPDLHAAIARLRTLNPSLSEPVARRLSMYGTTSDGQGGVRFRFDPALIVDQPLDLALAQKHRLWARVRAPVLLVYGADSWASNPALDGRMNLFADATTVLVPEAGHWVHLDQPSLFEERALQFLRG